MLDIPHDWLSRKSTKIKSLYYPDISAVSGNHLPCVLKQIGIGIVKNFNSGIILNQRIYISRKFARFRRVINEDELVPILEKFGFKVCYFESMNFQEQVKLVSGAEIILGMHGAGMTNMIFMPEGRQVVEFIIGGKGHNNCYYSMANSMGHKYSYLVTSSESPDQLNTNVKVDPIQLKNLLERL
jgi:capsular polysaccharide biosynthesis protein